VTREKEHTSTIHETSATQTSNCRNTPKDFIRLPEASSDFMVLDETARDILDLKTLRETPTDFQRFHKTLREFTVSMGLYRISRNFIRLHRTVRDCIGLAEIL
jgi:hypothetical protein